MEAIAEVPQPLIRAKELCRLIEVKGSPIHGFGVFARVRFQAGDYIGSYWGTRAREITPFTLHVQNEDGTLFLIEGRNLLRWINHSDQPNARFDGIHLFAQKTIVAGEEITFDYSAGEGIHFTD